MYRYESVKLERRTKRLLLLIASALETYVTGTVLSVPLCKFLIATENIWIIYVIRVVPYFSILPKAILFIFGQLFHIASAQDRISWPTVDSAALCRRSTPISHSVLPSDYSVKFCTW